SGPVDLRELLDFAAARRPFRLKGIALYVADIRLGLNCPGGYSLVIILLDIAQLYKLAFRYRQAKLFAELTFGGLEGLFTFFYAAFRNRPGAGVFLGPPRRA